MHQIFCVAFIYHRVLANHFPDENLSFFASKKKVMMKDDKNQPRVLVASNY